MHYELSGRVNRMEENIYLTTIRGILDQMAVGAGQLANLLLHVAVILTIIMLLWLLFTSGIIPIFNLKTTKNIGDIITPVAQIWM